MGERTELYFRGMQAVDNFFELLYSAMQTSMPGALLSTTGCMGWRGYRVDSYNNLALRQYYCQIYTGKPNELVFQEAYKDTDRKSLNTDSRDAQYHIYGGDYSYPFSLSLNLYKARFFNYTVSEQSEFLVNYVSYASEQAQRWQNSDARTNETAPQFLKGTKSSLHKRGELRPFGQVSADLLDVFSMQMELLNKLNDVIRDSAPSIMGRDIAWCFVNSNWRNWNFRGWRLKFDGLNPHRGADYVWEIYFNEPGKLVCSSYTNSKRKRLGYFDIQHWNFFDLSEGEATATLQDFVRRMLTMTG